MISTLAFVFKITRTIIFSAVKNASFPQSKKIFLILGLGPTAGLDNTTLSLSTEDRYSINFSRSNRNFV